jgi:hypothetical protein
LGVERFVKIKRTPSKLEKKARRGNRGYPAATVAFYGPDASRASKVAVGIILTEGAEAVVLQRWFSESSDARRDPKIGQEILAFIKSHGVLTVAMADRIIGCPHEEGIDYPDGQTCPSCPFWEERDRWSGDLLPTQ